MAVINTNVKALFSQMALSTSGRAQSIAMQQLSTGKRVNGAADDAAGNHYVGNAVPADLDCDALSASGTGHTDGAFESGAAGDLAVPHHGGLSASGAGHVSERVGATAGESHDGIGSV